MQAMVKNYWTTLIGVAVGIAYYLQGSGAKMPETTQEWWGFGVGLLLAALGVVAKDATTGSAPGAGSAKGPLLKMAVLALVCLLGLSGCAHALGYAGAHPGKIACKGKGTISGQGGAMAGAGLGGGEVNGFSLVADCGDGFTFEQGPPDATGVAQHAR